MTALTAGGAATFDQRHRLLAFALFALGFALVFRGWLFTGFDRAFGDEEDGYLALAIIEHWRHVFAGTVHWTDPSSSIPRAARSATPTRSFCSVPSTLHYAASASMHSPPSWW
jgi:hypothetical protein